MIYLKNPLCLGMEESEYKEMLALGGMRQKHFEKNEVILSAGCTTHEIGLVLSGSVNIENLDLWGSKSILSNIGAGQVFGETYAFSRETLMVDAVAAQQTDILFWNLDILVHTPHPASTWQPKFIRNLLQISLRKISRSPSGFSVRHRKRSAGGCLSICQTRRQKPAAIILRFRLTDRGWRTI